MDTNDSSNNVLHRKASKSAMKKEKTATKRAHSSDASKHNQSTTKKSSKKPRETPDSIGLDGKYWNVSDNSFDCWFLEDKSAVD